MGRVDPTQEVGDFPEDSGGGCWATRGTRGYSLVLGSRAGWGEIRAAFCQPESLHRASGARVLFPSGERRVSLQVSLRLDPWLPLFPQINQSLFYSHACWTQADSEGPGPSGHAEGHPGGRVYVPLP